MQRINLSMSSCKQGGRIRHQSIYVLWIAVSLCLGQSLRLLTIVLSSAQCPLGSHQSLSQNVTTNVNELALDDISLPTLELTKKLSAQEIPARPTTLTELAQHPQPFSIPHPSSGPYTHLFQPFSTKLAETSSTAAWPVRCPFTTLPPGLRNGNLTSNSQARPSELFRTLHYLRGAWYDASQ